jgi:hypothetical protein
MSRLTLRLPETLHRHLENLARREQVSLNQYIVYALTRQSTLAYYVQANTEEEVARQQAAFTGLLENLGNASPEEIDQALEERAETEPETDLNPDAVKRLRARLGERG